MHRGWTHRWTRAAALVAVLALVAGACGDDDDSGRRHDRRRGGHHRRRQRDTTAAGGTETTAADGDRDHRSRRDRDHRRAAEETTPAEPTKSPITIGMAVGETGTSGSTQKFARPVAEAWAEHVNTELGGINGHPVNLVVKDTKSDGATGAAVVRELVEQDNAARPAQRRLGIGVRLRRVHPAAERPRHRRRLQPGDVDRAAELVRHDDHDPRRRAGAVRVRQGDRRDQVGRRLVHRSGVVRRLRAALGAVGGPGRPRVRRRHRRQHDGAQLHGGVPPADRRGRRLRPAQHGPGRRREDRRRLPSPGLRGMVRSHGRLGRRVELHRPGAAPRRRAERVPVVRRRRAGRRRSAMRWTPPGSPSTRTRRRRPPGRRSSCSARRWPTPATNRPATRCSRPTTRCRTRTSTACCPQGVTYTEGQPSPPVSCFWVYTLEGGEFSGVEPEGESGNSVTSGPLKTACAEPLG